VRVVDVVDVVDIVDVVVAFVGVDVDGVVDIVVDVVVVVVVVDAVVVVVDVVSGGFVPPTNASSYDGGCASGKAENPAFSVLFLYDFVKKRRALIVGFYTAEDELLMIWILD
jgi:hypothetical protein